MINQSQHNKPEIERIIQGFGGRFSDKSGSVSRVVKSQVKRD